MFNTLPGTKLSIPVEFELPWSQTKLEIYNINATNDSYDVTQILDKHSDPTQTSNLFIMVCSTRCIEDVLQKVNSNQIKLKLSLIDSLFLDLILVLQYS